MITLDPWKLIGRISVSEAAFLIIGVNPLREDIGPDIAATANTYELAITEAVTSAHHHAWMVLHGHDSTRPHDIWGDPQRRNAMILTTELRSNVEAVLADPENVPVLLEIDPWYSATVTGEELNAWVDRNSVATAFQFPSAQQIVVAELDHRAILDSRREQNGMPPIGDELKALQTKLATVEPNALQERPVGPRERTTLLNTVAALLQYSGDKEAAIISAILEAHPSAAGLKERTLQKSFAEAKRSLASG